MASARRGRPTLGRPVLVVLSEAEINMAKELGGGVIAGGVRLALQVCRTIGPQVLADASAQGGRLSTFEVDGVQ